MSVNPVACTQTRHEGRSHPALHNRVCVMLARNSRSNVFPRQFWCTQQDSKQVCCKARLQCFSAPGRPAARRPTLVRVCAGPFCLPLASSLICPNKLPCTTFSQQRNSKQSAQCSPCSQQCRRQVRIRRDTAGPHAWRQQSLRTSLQATAHAQGILERARQKPAQPASPKLRCCASPRAGRCASQNGAIEASGCECP